MVNIQQRREGLPEVGHEDGSTVRDDRGGQTVKAENAVEEQPGKFGGSDGFVARDEMGGAG